ncbi:MAG TPA: cupin domain-containing protein [Candidatus Fusicatenibacter merdavium]|uniref:Cupin domain-containing protein n=1 Tax=Candidatus Fusicatenibacter merdavium TaxID=2838600 RepID=A0A9D1XEE1_9FIRM|nr:cupin domain-containing protein [Candidatus Fusicatenibacter merdavium]
MTVRPARDRLVGGKNIPYRIHPGGFIGTHRHDTSDDINYILFGSGKAICDGTVELLTAGCCHICPKGSEHSIINTGSEDLCLLTVVVER